MSSTPFTETHTGCTSCAQTCAPHSPYQGVRLIYGAQFASQAALSSMRLSASMMLVLLLVVFFSIFSPASVAGQEEPGLQISPAVLDVSGSVESAETTFVSLTNTSSEPLGVTVSTRSLVPEDEPIDASVVDRYDAAGWISLPTKDLLVDGFDTVQVPVEVTVPEDAVPGGHYSLVVFRIVNDEPPDGTGVVVNREAGAVVLITVPGDIQEQANIVTDTNAHVVFDGEYVLQQTVSNNGNSHFLPIITTEIKNRAGDVIETIAQPVQLLLPNTKRSFKIEWKSPSSLGVFSAETSVSYGTPTQIAEAGVDTFVAAPSVRVLLLWFVVSVATLRFAYTSVRKRSYSLKRRKNNE